MQITWIYLKAKKELLEATMGHCHSKHSSVYLFMKIPSWLSWWLTLILYFLATLFYLKLYFVIIHQKNEILIIWRIYTSHLFTISVITWLIFGQNTHVLVTGLIFSMHLMHLCQNFFLHSFWNYYYFSCEDDFIDYRKLISVGSKPFDIFLNLI